MKRHYHYFGSQIDRKYMYLHTPDLPTMKKAPQIFPITPGTTNSLSRSYNVKTPRKKFEC